MEVSGVTLGRKRTDVVPPNHTLRPLRDQMVVKPLDWQPSKILSDLGAKIIYQGNALRGEVLAIGPGCYPWQYNKDRSKRWESKQFRPTEVKVGDIVELGGLELRGYNFDKILWDNQEVIICTEKDVTSYQTP